MNDQIKKLSGIAKANTNEDVSDKFCIIFADLIATEAAEACRKHSDFLLRFSQFGSNAAADCAKIISSMFKEEN